MAQEMNDAGLDLRPGESRLDGLGEALEPVHDGNRSAQRRISRTPRLRRSFRTLARNLAPSFDAARGPWNHKPRTSRVPSGRMARATKTALFETAPSERISTRRGAQQWRP